MPGSKTAYLSQKLLDHVLGGVTYLPPDSVWFTVSLQPFDPNATGSSCNEVTANGYGRIPMQNTLAFWAAASAAAPSVKSNANDLTWPAATTAWGTPYSVYVADAENGGNLLYGADLSSSGIVDIADTFKILAGTFVFSED